MAGNKKLNGHSQQQSKPAERRRYPSQQKPTPPRRSLASDGAFVPTQPINPPGRASMYKPEYAPQARHLYEHGYIEPEVADFFGVSLATLQNWRTLHPEFAEAQVIGKKPADERVIRSCFMRAVGFTVKEEKIFCSDGEIVRAEVDKFYPPEVSAIVWWTKNRCGWRDKVEHSGDPERPIQHSYADELKSRLDKLSVPSAVTTAPGERVQREEDSDDDDAAKKLH